MTNRPDWCPKCASELTAAVPPAQEPCCDRHGYVVDKIYRCRTCGRPEEFRAIDDVPPSAHYCAHCAEALPADVREHVVGVVSRSTHVTGPWRPA